MNYKSYKKLLAAFLVLTTVSLNLSPLLVVAASENNKRPFRSSKNIVEVASSTTTQLLPEFNLFGGRKKIKQKKQVRDLSRSVIVSSSTLAVPDLARVDWDATDVSDAPEEVLDAVRFYEQERDRLTANSLMAKNEKDRKKKILKEGLEVMIEAALVKRGDLPENYFELKRNGAIYNESQIIDLSKHQDKVFQVEDKDIKRKTKSLKAEFKEFRKNVKKEAKTKKRDAKQNRSNREPVSFLESAADSVRSFFSVPVANAQAASPQSLATTYLKNAQIGNGAWGLHEEAFTKTITSIDALYKVGETSSQEYQNGLDWLEFFITDNLDYRAEKIRVRNQAGYASPQSLEILAYSRDLTTGGFAFDTDYQPDALTTAKALRALTETNYQDEGTDPNVTVTGALYYLSQVQRFDGGFSASENGESLVYVTAEVIRSLYPYLGTTITLGNGTTISITEVVDDAIAFVRGQQAGSGLWENDLLTTALVFATLKDIGIDYHHEQTGVNALLNAQLANGSIDNDVYKTAVFIQAIQEGSVASSDVSIYDLAFSGPMETGVATTLDISIRNDGESTVNTGSLRLFVDHVFIEEFDLATLGLSLDPDQTGTIYLSIADTWSLLDDVNITVFYDDESGNKAEGAWYEEDFVFAANSNGNPGVPTYFIAQKYELNGLPALNVRWDENDVDPDRMASTVLWREVGQTTWTYYDWTGSGNGFIIAGNGLGTDKQYEVTIGARKNQLGPAEWTVRGDYATVRLNADSTVYTGDVSGVIDNSGSPGANIDYFGYDFNSGIGSGSSDGSGIFSEDDLQNGRGGMWVSQLPYQKFVSTFDIPETGSVSGIAAYTRVIPDNQAPVINFVGASGSPVVNNNLRTIFLYASDDVGLTRAVFEYYDVATDTWKLIATSDSVADTLVNFDWFVPSNLLGTGYKIRATAYDYAGNASATVESSSFEIVAGAHDPELSFIEPNGSGDTADGSFLISWDDHDPDSSALIDLYFDVDTIPGNGNEILIVADISEDDFLNQYAWDTTYVDDGAYLIYAVISDDSNIETIYAPGAVTVANTPVQVSGPAAKVRYYMNGQALTGMKHDNSVGDSLFDLSFESGTAISTVGYNNETDGTYQFNGGERLKMGSIAPVTPGSDSMTVSFRVKSWLDSGAPIKYLLTGNAPSESYSISAAIHQGKLLADVTWKENGQETGIGAYSNMAINDNAWHKVDLVIYNENGVGKYDLYIDGVLDTQKAHASSAYNIGDLSNGWNIGAWYNRYTGAYVAHLEDSLIDDVALFDFALSAEEVNQSIPAPPVISLLGDSHISMVVGGTFTEPGYSAYDFQDGDLTSSVVVTGSVDTSTAGTYVLQYNVTDSDSMAATEVTRTVTVSEPASAPAPLISYEFNGALGSAGKPADSGSNGLDLTTSGVTSATGIGSVADGAYFIGSGTNRYLEHADDPASPTGSFAIEALVKLENTGSNDVQVITNRAGSVGERAILFQRGYGAAGDDLHFRIYDENDSIWDLRSDNDIPLGEWVHIVAVFESGVATRIYVNGVLDGENTSNIPTAIKDVGSKFIIGQHELEKSNSNTAFNGAMDFVRIYDSALDAAEVTTLYSTAMGN